MATFVVVTIMASNGPQPQAINIEAITRFIPVKGGELNASMGELSTTVGGYQNRHCQLIAR